jgi:hypothetical protein
MHYDNEVLIPGINLPDDCRMLDYGGDLLMIGVNLTQDRFKEINVTLPANIQTLLLGWKRVAKVMA